ncbi:hypothetical protein B0O99DRAFT_628286, partial [Bisporella sp. PMI_857]
MEDSKKIHSGAKKAIDSGAEKPIDNRAEQTINDQDKPEITMEYLMMVARNSMVARNTRDMAKLTLDDMAKNNIPRDKTGNIDCSKIKFDPGFIPPPLDIKKRLEQLRGYLDPNDPWYQPEYQHTNIRAIIKLYEEGLIDGSQHVYVQDGKLVSREQSFKGPAPAITEGVFHQYAQKTCY